MATDESAGVRVRLAVDARDACPVAAATEGGAEARGVTWAGGDEVVEEFDLVDDGSTAPPADGTVVFEADGARRVRFNRDSSGCICEAVERHGCPVSDVGAADGTLRLTFYAGDVDTVRAVVEDLSEAFGDVRLDRLARTDEGGDGDYVVVDRGRLTDRQLEVLGTALEMGYFSRPREANATEVAEALDISLSTFAEHMAAAQAKVVGSIVDR